MYLQDWDGDPNPRPRTEAEENRFSPPLKYYNGRTLQLKIAKYPITSYRMYSQGGNVAHLPGPGPFEVQAKNSHANSSDSSGSYKNS